MKKLALLLFGLSLYNDRNHWIYKTKTYSIDWKLSFNNYQKYILEFFKSKGYKIDVYLCSNILSQEDTKDLLEKWKPRGYDFIESDNDRKNRFRQRNEKIRRVMELCIDSKVEYDNILITRFDMIFKLNFDKINLDYCLFNSAFYMTKTHMCDNFLFMKYKSLLNFYKLTVENMDLKGHKFKNLIEKTEKIHYLYKTTNEITIPNNFFYRLIKVNNYNKNLKLKFWDTDFRKDLIT